MTAPTSTGKTSIALRLAAHTALGLKLGDREVEQGKVLYLAGENPDDVRMRWIKLCEELKVEPKDVPVFFLPSNPRPSEDTVRKQIDEESALHGPFVLVIVDTSAAYFEGDDEINNVQMGKHARMLRGLAKLPDGPTIIVTCHPTKKAETLDWTYSNGQPNKSRVDRIVHKLQRQKLVKQDRDGWQLTKEGAKAAEETPAARAAEHM
jgi:RecA-family ATPase